MNEKINFETALAELQNIVSLLESGNCTLDESLELFEKGISLSKKCNKCLEQAKLKIEKLEGTDN